MPRFLTGDELGNIKSVKYFSASATTPETTLLIDGNAARKAKAIQGLAVSSASSTGLTNKVVAAACADGSASAYIFNEEHGLDLVKQWKEPRLKSGQKYVGMAVSGIGSSVYSCTSNGALRLTHLDTIGTESAPASQTAVLPTRICDWRLSSDETTFAYGGNEVEVSVWDVERDFSSSSTPTPHDTSEPARKKRKRDELLPGELWRANNVPHNHLNLREPVLNTCLTYLCPHTMSMSMSTSTFPSATTSQPSYHIVAGTQLGSIRRYDTRAARRPVADLKGVAKISGVKAVAQGFNEHELFVADQGCNLFSLDLRNGNINFSYKGISGAVTSLAPSPTYLASTALDRYTRIHSTFAPPAKAGGAQINKGQILEKVYMNSIPTFIVWDGEVDEDTEDASGGQNSEEDDDEDIWDALENVGDDEDEESNEEDGIEGSKKRKSKSKKSRTR